MSQQRRYQFQSLDALRGVAIAAVMVLHCAERGHTTGNPWVDHWIWPVASHGYLGVQLFFVISGYCIAAAVYSMRGKERPLRTFLIRRARRIFPPYWWSIGLVLVLGLGTVLLMKQGWYSVFPLRPVDWLLNLFLMQTPFGAPDLSLTYWSLSIEIQFYALMALCLTNVKRAEIYLVAVSIVSMLLLAFPSRWISGIVFAYWPEFACGIAAFYWITGEHRWRATPWCLIALVALTAAAAWRLEPSTLGPSGHLALPYKLLFCMTLTAALVWLHQFDAQISSHRLLRIPALLGVISYTLYLIHVPLATRVFNFGQRLTGLNGPWWAIYSVVAGLVVLVGGAFFYRFCERPWLNTRPRLPVEPQIVPEIVPQRAAYDVTR
jgi:peptidoglycan/LPS O-acetylase OafA/YrhL